MGRVTGKQPPASMGTTILRHCRCMDCPSFSNVGDEHFCSEYIGGTKVTWATGNREFDPPPDAWHYCSDYHGPQTSTDVWVWSKTVQGKEGRADVT